MKTMMVMMMVTLKAMMVTKKKMMVKATEMAMNQEADEGNLCNRIFSFRPFHHTFKHLLNLGRKNNGHCNEK